MAENQTLAVLQEILLKSRIKFVTGTEAEWTAANPVLLDGEYGLIRGSSPLKYKVGDGTAMSPLLPSSRPTQRIGS